MDISPFKSSRVYTGHLLVGVIVLLLVHLNHMTKADKNGSCFFNFSHHLI